MKKLLISLLVVTLLLTAAAPALAARGPQPPFKNRGALFNLTGFITAIDGTTVTVQVVAGNPIVKPFIGQTVNIQTTAQTRFLLQNADGTATPITFDYLEVGQGISVQGQLINEVWTANRITVGAKLEHIP
jgi:uncharacterized membrane protein